MTIPQYANQHQQTTHKEHIDDGEQSISFSKLSENYATFEKLRSFGL
jgi:hypothetical protein